MENVVRYQDGICDEKGKVIALYTKGWWYEPKLNKLGLLEMESCSKDKNDEYNTVPITHIKKQFIFKRKEMIK